MARISSSFVLANMVSFTMGYYLLSSYYSPLSSWLAPYFGSNLYFILALFFLTLGNPITYPILLVTCVTVGVTIGIFSRKVLRAIGVTISVYMWSLSMMGLAFALYAINYVPSFGGSSGSGTPAFLTNGQIPHGTNLATIISEPVFLAIFPTVLKLISTFATSPASAASPTSIIPMILPILEGTIISIIICSVTASLVAYAMRRLAGHGTGKAMPKSPASLSVFIVIAALILGGAGALAITHDSYSGASPGMYATPFSELNRTAQGELISSAVSGSLSLPDGLFTSSVLNSSNSSLSSGYMESALSLVSPYGNLYSMYFMASNKTIPQGGTQGFGQIGFSFFIMSTNLSYMAERLVPTSTNSGNGSSLGSLLNLIPPEILVVEVSKGPVNTSVVANAQASYYSSVTGTQLIPLFNTNSLPSGFLGLSSLGLDIFIYVGAQEIQTIGHSFSKGYLASLHNGGLINILESGLSSGSLLGGSGYGSSSGVVIAGYSNISSLFSLPSAGGNSSSPISTAFFSGKMAFVLGLFSKSIDQYGSKSHSVSWSSLTGYNQGFNFSSRSALSLAGIIYPGNTSGYTTGSVGSTYNATIYASNVTAMHAVTSGKYWDGIQTNSSHIFSSSATLQYNATLPPLIQFHRTITSSGNVYSVTVKATNAGNTTVSNVNLTQPGITAAGNDSRLIHYASSTSRTGSLAPGSSVSVTFTFPVLNPGTYVLSAPILTFTDGNSTYSVPYTTASVTVAPPPIYTAATGFFTFIVYSSLSRFVAISQLEAEILTIALLALIIGLSVYTQARSFMKWRKARTTPPPP